MYDYLPIPEEEAKRLTMGEAGYTVWFRTPKTLRCLLKWYVWCALETGCIAPAGASLNCTFHGEYFTDYVGCHRYDQSSLSIIAAFNTEYDESLYFVPKNILSADVRKMNKDLQLSTLLFVFEAVLTVLKI